MGVILMLTGLLVYRNPMLISGVNTMSNERLSKVDLEGLKRALRNALMISGAVLLLLGGLSTLVDIPEGVHYALMMVVVTVMVVVAFVVSRRYDAGQQGEEGRKERRKGGIVLAIVVTLLVASLGFYFFASGPARIEVSKDGITAKSSLYKVIIPVTDIVSITELSEWPDIAMRTNGVGTSKVSIGHFRLKNGENCMLFLCTDGGPVLEVRTIDGQLYYLNCATEEETLEMIAKVNALER
jgi:amino acid transporter